MDHWFDRLTKNVASNGITRRTFIDGALAGVALTALDWRFDRVLAAALPSSAVLGTKVRFPPSIQTTSTIQPRSLAFGPCTVMTQGKHYERHFKSATQVSGHAVSVERNHVSDKDQPTQVETKFLIDGKPQLVSSMAVSKSSRSYKLEVGEAFGFTAMLTSENGKTVRGTIDGRAVVPFTDSATGTVKFEGGAPPKGQAKPYLKDAIKAGFTHANEELKSCVPPVHAFDARRSETTRVADGLLRRGPTSSELAYTPPCYDCDHSALMVYQPSGAVFTPGCQACVNKCNNALNNCLTSNGLAAGFSLGADYHADYMLAIGCNSDDVSCVSACFAGPCLGQLCPGEKQSLESTIAGGGTLSAPVPSCDRNEVCVSSYGFCCPKTHPNPCPGWYDDIMIGSTLASNICCQLGYACLWDTSSGYFGCCPKERTCKQTWGAYRNAAYGIQGQCCAPGDVCDGHGNCCPPRQLSGGVCCGGAGSGKMWCGGHCITCSGQCVEGRCQHICLSGYTTSGKCCTNGEACGSKCCENGCADSKTSRCITTPPSYPPIK